MPLPPHASEGFYLSKWQGKATPTGIVYQSNLARLVDSTPEIGWFWIKATNGASGVDSLWDEGRADAPASGRPFGAFHFYLNADNPISQARHFWRTAGGASHGLRVRQAYDFEDPDPSTGGEITQRMLDFVGESDALWGAPGILYSRKSIWDPLYRRGANAPLPILAGHDWWVAHYNEALAGPALPIDAGSWSVWQTGNRPGGQIPGVPATTTRDLLAPNLTVAHLCYPIAPPAPPPIPAPALDRTAEILRSVALDLLVHRDVGIYKGYGH